MGAPWGLRGGSVGPGLCGFHKCPCGSAQWPHSDQRHRFLSDTWCRAGAVSQPGWPPGTSGMPTGPWTPEVAPLLWGPWAGPVTPRASQVPAWPLMTRRKARPQVMPQGEDGPRVSSRTCSLGSTLQPRGHTECHNACSTDAVTALPMPGPVSSACLVQSFTSGFFHSDVNT